ncbi:unnamed protein product [Anisakis simplex]|uniref:DNA repair protein REV1 (inferred by orthology to a human protein) n=1 Tax=Anisakis simplex TaxID=6269 RepID=A0A0M3K3G7_ANISI|nr:unnamed protein product [Anisakis simplex]
MDETTSASTSAKDDEPIDSSDQWRRYMSMKKSKLLYQINARESKPKISGIFDGVSIYINGYTDPPASELRRLIQQHGGEFHIYYEYGTTTYTVATHIATGKVNKLRRNEKVIHPKWILDSIGAGERLPESNYLVYKNSDQHSAVGISKFVKRGENTLNAATDPNFITNFYERSRLHLISTLAQEMKQYVSELRSASRTPECPTETICHIDLDCYFVSIALRTRPELRGKPVAVTHSRGSEEGAGMSEVASCSYEARACGVRNGCYVKQAKSLCPDLICVPYQFDEYRKTSKLIYDILTRFIIFVEASIKIVNFLKGPSVSRSLAISIMGYVLVRFVDV